jgi:hypothetical protein
MGNVVASVCSFAGRKARKLADVVVEREASISTDASAEEEDESGEESPGCMQETECIKITYQLTCAEESDGVSMTFRTLGGDGVSLWANYMDAACDISGRLAKQSGIRKRTLDVVLPDFMSLRSALEGYPSATVADIAILSNLDCAFRKKFSERLLSVAGGPRADMFGDKASTLRKLARLKQELTEHGRWLGNFVAMTAHDEHLLEEALAHGNQVDSLSPMAPGRGKIPVDRNSVMEMHARFEVWKQWADVREAFQEAGFIAEDDNSDGMSILLSPSSSVSDPASRHDAVAQHPANLQVALELPASRVLERDRSAQDHLSDVQKRRLSVHELNTLTLRGQRSQFLASFEKSVLQHESYLARRKGATERSS